MLNATIVGRENLTDTLIFLRVKPDSGVVTFEPGQYLALGLPEVISDAVVSETQQPAKESIIKRTYSIASSPDQTEYYEFYIAILPQGQLTARMTDLQVGDRIFAGRKPVGTFTLAGVPKGADVICFATGTGLAPFMSMVSTSGILALYNSFTLIHGVRYASDLAYQDYLEGLMKQHANFKFLATVSRESPGWTGSRGYVQDFINSGLIVPNPECQHIMLCGNPSMIGHLESLLGQIGFREHSKKNPGNLHLEKYW